MPSLVDRIARLEKHSGPDPACTCFRRDADNCFGLATNQAELDALKAGINACPAKHPEEPLIVVIKRWAPDGTLEFARRERSEA
jgi:hypothetical protein